MSKIQIIIGSTRPGRIGPKIAKWVQEFTSTNFNSETFELVDVADYNLPLLDEPKLPAMEDYTNEHTKKWASKIAEGDGYILVHPEYNHGYGAATKNALDFLYAEWNNKPIAFVGYGAIGGVRATEQLRQVIVQLQMIGIASSLQIVTPHQYIADDKFNTTDDLEKQLQNVTTKLLEKAKLLKSLRK